MSAESTSPKQSGPIPVRIYEKPHTRSCADDDENYRYYHIAVAGNPHELAGFLTEEMKQALEGANKVPELLAERCALKAENEALRNLANNLQPGPISEALVGARYTREERHVMPDGICVGTTTVSHGGLTIREEFAKAAMQGILAAGDGWPSEFAVPEIARRAVLSADALIAELAKPLTPAENAPRLSLIELLHYIAFDDEGDMTRAEFDAMIARAEAAQKGRS